MEQSKLLEESSTIYKPKGTILTIHGACEHAGRYQAWKDSARNDGWEVLNPDLPGHGMNQSSTRSHLDHPEEYLYFLANELRSSSIKPPLFIMGHSLGGLLASRLIQLWPTLFDNADMLPHPAGLIMLSPLFAVAHPVPTWKYLLGKICFYIRPTCRFSTKIKGFELTSDLAQIKAWHEDPLIAHSVTAGWFFHIQELIRRGNVEISNLGIPTLVLQSGDDYVVDPGATKRLFDRLPSSNKTFELLPHLKHELLNEVNRQQTIARILRWVNSVIQEIEN